MKNYKLFCALAALMLFLVAGCGGGSKGGVGTPGAVPGPGGSGGSAAPKQEYVTVGPLKANEAAVLGKVTVTLGEMDARSAGMAVPGYDYFLVQVTIENKTDAAMNINPLNIFQMEEPGGQKLNLNAQALTTMPRLGDQVMPQQKITGWLGFLTKIDDGIYKLHVRFPDHGEAIFEFEAPLM